MRIIVFALIVLFFLKELMHIILELANTKHSTSPNIQIPEVLSDSITQEVFEKSKRYQKDKSKLELISNLTGLIVSIIFIFFIFPYLERIVSGLTSLILQGLIFFGIYGLINFIISLPFGLYSIFIIEERYGFNTTKPITFFIDTIKSIILTAILGGGLLWVILRIITTDPIWWWKFMIVFTAIQILSIWLYPAIIAPLFNKFTPIKDESLKKKIFDIAERTKFSLSNIFIMDASKRSKKANAFFSGLGKMKKLVLFDTLANYPVEEVCAIFAHEVGHFKKKHILKMILINTLITFIYVYLTYILYSSGILQGVFNINKEYTLLIYSFLFTSSLVYFLNPLLNLISRDYEFEADKFSAQTIETPTPLINGLKRLIKENLSNINPLPLYANWYYSHPGPEERILALMKYKTE